MSETKKTTRKEQLEALKLPDAVAKKFKLKQGFHAGKYLHKTEKIDLSTISVAKAEQIVKEGFEALVAIDDKPEAKK